MMDVRVRVRVWIVSFFMMDVRVRINASFCMMDVSAVSPPDTSLSTSFSSLSENGIPILFSN